MINYNYLSCTDYDGKTKEINFCSENLPKSASADCTYLALHTDTNNPDVLHVKKVEAAELFEKVVKPTLDEYQQEMADALAKTKAEVETAAKEDSKLYSAVLEIYGEYVQADTVNGLASNKIFCDLTAQFFYRKKFTNESVDKTSLNYSGLLDFIRNYLGVPGAVDIPVTGYFSAENNTKSGTVYINLAYNELRISAVHTFGPEIAVFSEATVNDHISIKLRTWEVVQP
jgi:hypothetical protein